MKTLFIKLPSDKKVDRIGYNMTKFLNDHYQTEGFELLFEDNDGYCCMSPFSMNELGLPGNILNLDKLFKTGSDYLSGALVVYFQDTKKGTVLEGWYKNADIYIKIINSIQQAENITILGVNQQTQLISRIQKELQAKSNSINILFRTRKMLKTSANLLIRIALQN